MRPSLMVPLVVLALLVAACSVRETASPSPGASDSATSPSASPEPLTSIGDRRPLPSGFPVLPGAVSVAMPPDDVGLIGLWESDRVGSAAYDFYVAALPEAGYPIIGLYPGGEVALIRFSVPDGEIWQLLAHGAADGGVAIEVRLDRP